jgi:hypothetical protein
MCTRINQRFLRVVQKLQFLNNFRLKPAKCRASCTAFAATRERTHTALEQVHYNNDTLFWTMFLKPFLAAVRRAGRRAGRRSLSGIEKSGHTC